MKSMNPSSFRIKFQAGGVFVVVISKNSPPFIFSILSHSEDVRSSALFWILARVTVFCAFDDVFALPLFVDETKCHWCSQYAWVRSRGSFGLTAFWPPNLSPRLSCLCVKLWCVLHHDTLHTEQAGSGVRCNKSWGCRCGVPGPRMLNWFAIPKPCYVALCLLGGGRTPSWCKLNRPTQNKNCVSGFNLRHWIHFASLLMQYGFIDAI